MTDLRQYLRVTKKANDSKVIERGSKATASEGQSNAAHGYFFRCPNRMKRGNNAYDVYFASCGSHGEYAQFSGMSTLVFGTCGQSTSGTQRIALNKT